MKIYNPDIKEIAPRLNECNVTRELGSRLATYINTLAPSMKLQHKGKKLTSYAPLAVDRQKAINDSISAEIMLKTIRAGEQRSKRQGYAEARKNKHN